MLYHRSRIITRRESIYLYSKIYIHLPSRHLLYQRSPSIKGRGGEGRKISGARKSATRVYNAYREEEEEKKKSVARGARKVKEGKEGKVGRLWQGGAWRWRGRSEASFRGVMYRRNFKVKKTRGSGRGTRLPRGEIAQDTSAERERVSFSSYPPAAPFHSSPSFPFSRFRFRSRNRFS